VLLHSDLLAQALKQHGYLPALHLSCRDDIESIHDALTYLCTRTSAVIISGGLGPTSDDQTRHALARWKSEPLELREDQLLLLKAYFRRKQRDFEGANRIQAMFPPSSKVIPNPNGTAAGIYLQNDEGALIFALPGVPSELHAMFQESVVPLLKEALPLSTHEKVQTIHLFGLPESTVGRRISELNISEAISLGYRAHFPELEVRLSSSDPEAPIEGASQEIQKMLGEEYVVSSAEDMFLPEVISHLLLHQRKTVAVAESCTGGLLGKLLTDRSGSSAFFLGGALTYSNEAKQKILSVSPHTLENYGAVSEQTAMEMARGTRELLGADIGISLTGIAGPEGGSDEKPVGTFYLGISTEGHCEASRYFFSGSRNAVRRYAAYCALDCVRRYLSGFPLR
ncbi:MAG: CinA family nicotinamide mononucleotide deamidase-related protein, partial [Bdellovibrionales bacterium]|nr:CinA family nicotinamide mononucleotide deamidase-related protein [Bdellovibrionales bacterium]